MTYTAQILHLLPTPPLAVGPDPGTVISTTSANGGRMTTQLLDPAVPSPLLTGTNQVVAYAANGLPIAGSTTKNLVVGRWLTRPLPAQTIGAAIWSLSGTARAQTGGSATNSVAVFGFCVAQWRPGTGVIARAVDLATSGGTVQSPGTAGADISGRLAGAGSSLTLLANDCLIVELWSQVINSAGTSGTITVAILLGGLGLYQNATVDAMNGNTDTDAVLYCSVPITFS